MAMQAIATYGDRRSPAIVIQLRPTIVKGVFEVTYSREHPKDTKKAAAVGTIVEVRYVSLIKL